MCKLVKSETENIWKKEKVKGQNKFQLQETKAKAWSCLKVLELVTKLSKNYIKENCNEKSENLSSHEKTHSESASVKILPSAVIEVEKKIVEGEMAKDAGISLNILDTCTSRKV